MTTLRPYQTEARYQLNTLINARRHPVFVSPTGTGKTKTAVAVIEDRINMGRRIWVLCPQEEIFNQWEKELAPLNAGTIDSHGVLGRNRSVYVVMPISADNMLSMIPEAIYPDEIWTDEAHHSAADTWESIYRFFPNAIRIGLTATPKRTDGKGLDHLYTDIVQTITMQEAIDNGYLAKPLCIVPEEYHNIIDIPNGDIDTTAGLERQAALLGDTRIIGDVIANYENVFTGLPVLVACSTFEHANMMTDAFRAAGWKWNHIHSGLSKADRKRMLREIRTGKLNGLCTVGIGIEGMDIPGLYGLIWLRRTLSLTIFLQFIGRVLRPMEGKEYGIILDPVGNLFIHGFPESPRQWSLSSTRDWGASKSSETECGGRATMRICPACGVANGMGNINCHFCGRSLQDKDGNPTKCGRHLPCIVDGALVAVTSDGQAQALHERIERAHTEASAHVEKHSQQPQALTKSQIGGIIREGLFTSRRPLFNEAVKGLK